MDTNESNASAPAPTPTPAAQNEHPAPAVNIMPRPGAAGTPMTPKQGGMTFPSKVLIGLVILTAIAAGGYFALPYHPAQYLFWEQEKMPEVPEVGLGAELYDTMSAEAGAETAVGIPDASPLADVDADPYADYENPFE